MWKAWIHEINTRLWSTFSSTWDISTKQYEKQKHGRRWVAKNKHRSSYPSKTESYCLTSSISNDKIYSLTLQFVQLQKRSKFQTRSPQNSRKYELYTINFPCLWKIKHDSYLLLAQEKEYHIEGTPLVLSVSHPTEHNI